MNIRRNRLLLYGISLLQGMVFYGPISTLYREAAGVNIFQITVIESISLLLTIALEMPWGLAADRIGYKWVMVISSMLYFLSKIVFWRAEGFGGFLLERLMLSVVCAGISGCDTAILYLSSEKGQTQRVFGIYNQLNVAGLLFASAVYSVFVKEAYRLAGFLTVLSYGAAALLSLGLKEVRQESSERVGFLKLLLTAVSDKGFLAALVGIVFFNETRQTITVFLNQLQYERCGISPSSMGYILIFVTMTQLCGVWSYKLTKRMGVKCFSAGLYGAAASACVILAFTESAAWSIAAVCSLDVAFCLFQPMQAELQNRHVRTAERTSMLSIYAVILEGTGALMNVLFGRAARADLPLAMLLGAACCAVGGCLFLGWYRREEVAPQELS